MFSRKRVAMALGAALGVAGVVWACGPDFPNQLLDHRAASLKATPQNDFSWEAQHLLVATDALKPNESSGEFYGEPPTQTEAAKAQGLTLAQLLRVTALRQASDGGKAYEDGKDLPKDLSLYTAGAIDYAAAMAPCKAADGTTAAAPASCAGSDGPGMASAEASFEKVLALPPDQARLRSVWAAYMLGRIHAMRAAAQAADANVFTMERDAAAKAFQLARTRAVGGASDTQGLAVASFGEEARLSLYSGQQQCTWSDLYAASNACGDGIALADIKHAIALYAAQAGHGSDNAVQSLAALAGIVLRDNQRATALIDGPVSQRLLVAYALARMGGEASYDDVTGAPGPVTLDPVLPALVQAIETRGVDHVASADRLAALAYRNGQYDLASKLADKASGPLASWVKAKLALHKGDLAAAAAAYAEAVNAFPKDGDSKPSIQPSNTRLIVGEQGVLALARGEYVEAMSQLYAASHRVGDRGIPTDDDYSSPFSYRNDAFYLAERVLTVDELKAFVDAHAAPSLMPEKRAMKDFDNGVAPLADSLRWLLARRLMRAGRYDDAQNYFPSSGDPRFGDVDLRAKAREYATSLHDVGSAWTDIGKAEALYAAAVIARENGMEILGFEQAPDYFDNGGAYQGGSGHSIDDLKQRFVTDGERQRFSESTAKRDWRFHYRYIAADEAVSASDLLPPRSQAFAGVLCQAAKWMRAGPPDYSNDDRYHADLTRVGAKAAVPSEAQRRVDAYYQRYVKQGAYVAWAVNFGENCQAPDFERARELLKHQRIVRAKHLVRHHLPYEIAGFALMLVGFGAWCLRRRRRKAMG